MGFIIGWPRIGLLVWEGLLFWNYRTTARRVEPVQAMFWAQNVLLLGGGSLMRLTAWQ